MRIEASRSWYTWRPGYECCERIMHSSKLAQIAAWNAEDVNRVPSIFFDGDCPMPMCKRVTFLLTIWIQLGYRPSYESSTASLSTAKLTESAKDMRERVSQQLYQNVARQNRILS